MISFRRRYMRAWRFIMPTITGTPADPLRSCSRSASAKFSTGGFSTKTGIPRSIQSKASGVCVLGPVQIKTASRDSSSSMRRWSV